jgi:hypothetical protein
MKGSLTLGELKGSLHLLEIRCTKCDRYGRERLTRLIKRYGREARLPDVHRLAADCPYQKAAVYDRCDVYFPQFRATKMNDAGLCYLAGWNRISCSAYDAEVHKMCLGTRENVCGILRDPVALSNLAGLRRPLIA